MGVLTHWPLGDFILILVGNFQANFSEWWLRYLLWNCPQVNATRPYWWWANVDPDLCHQMASLGFNELTQPVVRLEYSKKTRSVRWLLMPWLLALLCHQLPWCWLRPMGIFLSIESETAWWWHQMETFSVLLALCEWKQWRRWWFEMLSHSLWHHCKAPVPLWRIVVRINVNDIACEWRRFVP